MTQPSHRSYAALLVASVLGPALLFVAVAIWSWDRVHRVADEEITGRVALLQEQGLRLLQVDRVLLDRIDDRVAGMSWPDIIQQEGAITRFLVGAVSEIPEIDAAFIADAQGEPQVSSLLFAALARMAPSPTSANISNRPYFAAVRDGEEFAVDGPYRNRATGEATINVVRRLSAPDGSFRGAAVLIVSSRNLAGAWRNFTQPGDTVSLVREDGTVLVRYPAVPASAAGEPPRFRESSVQQLRAADAGLFDTPPSGLDGIRRRAGFRKLGTYPIYIVYGVDRRNISNVWYPTVAAFGGLSAAAAIGLLLAAFAVIRGARAEAAAHALASRERRFSELLLESSIDGIISKDRELRYTVWNRGMEGLSGLPRERVLGRRTVEVFGKDDTGPANEQLWRDALEGRSSSVQDQPYSVRETGRHGYYDQTLSPLRDADGTIIGAIAFIHDSTERHHIEEALRQSQKMEAVGQLTGGIAHDFNNLLTVILGNLETMQRRGVADPEMRRLVETVIRSAERAASLTQGLLAFSRRQPLNPRPQDLNRLVAGMSDLLRHTLDENIAVETVLAGGLWRVTVDQNQLESAILNLAVNARDAMPKGGKLTIETANIMLDEDYSARHGEVVPGQYVMIAVSDTGTGMRPEVLERAFEPFFTTKEFGKGSGLGLSQIYGFIKQSGGHVKIYSELGQGTTVKLYLPRLHETATEMPPPDRAAPAAHGSGTILLVEDEESVRDHARRLLHELGYGVVEAADAQSALAALEAHPEIRLLFTDVGLPGGINGRQLADEALRRRPGLKVLYTTGYARNAIIHQGRLDPGLQLIVKPFTFAGLAAKLRQVMEGDETEKPARAT